MDKFRDINLTDALRTIMETNTVDYKTDLKYDIDIINRAAQSSDPQEKTVLWLSHFSGTNCDTERQTFMEKTEGNVNWCSFEGYTNERILAYAAEVGSIDDNGIVTGDLYELDYYKHVGHVRTDSIPCNEDIKTIFFKDGYVNQVSPEDALHIILYSKEDVSYFRNEPENLAALEKLLEHEKENREQSGVIGDFDEHIRRLQDGRITLEAEMINAELKKLTEPNSPDKKGFIVKLSPLFTKIKTSQNIRKLIKAIPYKCVKICSLSGGGGICAIVSANEILKSRKPSILGQVKDKAASIHPAEKKDRQNKKDVPEV